MKNSVNALMLWILGVAPLMLRADSPVTSTPFSEAYLDIPMVRQAQEAGTMSLEIAEYLCNDSIPVDIKAAIVNALSWDLSGKSNAELFSYYLGVKYRKRLPDLDIDSLTPDEVFCLGYLLVMDDYFEPAEAIPLLMTAEKRNANSFTVAIIAALAKAQKAMDSDWGEVWRLTDSVLKNKALKRDMRPAAIQTIVDYMILYREY